MENNDNSNRVWSSQNNSNFTLQLSCNSISITTTIFTYLLHPCNQPNTTTKHNVDTTIGRNWGEGSRKVVVAKTIPSTRQLPPKKKQKQLRLGYLWRRTSEVQKIYRLKVNAKDLQLGLHNCATHPLDVGAVPLHHSFLWVPTSFSFLPWGSFS